MGPINNSDPTTYKLSFEEKQFYEDNGYLVLKKFIGDAILDKLRHRFVQVVKKEVPRGRVAVIADTEIMKKTDNPEDYVNKLNQLNYDEVFMEYNEHPRLMDALSQLIGADKRILNSMLINKPAGSPEHPIHQDVYHMPYQPADRVMTTWTAIDAADVTNGCLYVIPGSHKDKKIYEQELLPGFVNSLFFKIKDADQLWPVEKRVSLSVEPGDTVFLHAYMVHGSWPSQSKRHRKAITCIYASSECKYFDVTGTVQEPFMVEFYKEIQRRGYKGSYQDYWESKIKDIENV